MRIQRVSATRPRVAAAAVVRDELRGAVVATAWCGAGSASPAAADADLRQLAGDKIDARRQLID